MILYERKCDIGDFHIEVYGNVKNSIFEPFHVLKIIVKDMLGVPPSKYKPEYWSIKYLRMRGWSREDIQKYLTYEIRFEKNIDFESYFQLWNGLRNKYFPIVLYDAAIVEKIEQEHIVKMTDLGVKLVIGKLTY